MKLQIEQLTDKESPYFKTICQWQYQWWGIKSNYSLEKVIEWMEHCLNKDILAQTYIAKQDDKVVGMYQIVMYDDIDIRPDYYPWLAKVFVAEPYRGQGFFNLLMEDFKKQCHRLNIDRIYLHSHHTNLYEKIGCVFLESVEGLGGKVSKIYELDMKNKGV